MKSEEKSSLKKNGMTNATAGAMGAIVGGMVGAAAGIALSDKQKRKMILQKVDDLKRYVTNTLDEIQEMSQDTTDLIAQEALPGKKENKRKTKTPLIRSKERAN